MLIQFSHWSHAQHNREGMRQWADVHTPKRSQRTGEEGEEGEEGEGEGEQAYDAEESREARLERLDEEQLGSRAGEEEEGDVRAVAPREEDHDALYVPPYVTVLTDFLRLATEARVVNTSDLDDEQLFNTLQMMERERASATPDSMAE